MTENVALSSVFFSGFFLSLDYLWAPARTISWLLVHRRMAQV